MCSGKKRNLHSKTCCSILHLMIHVLIDRQSVVYFIEFIACILCTVELLLFCVCMRVSVYNIYYALARAELGFKVETQEFG